MKKTIWMFSGQGSQFFHMGRELYASEPVFREVLERGDRIAKPLINDSLIEIIYGPRENRFEPFGRIVHSHPAILLVECALAETLLARGLRPDYLLGYSVGEFSSLVIAGSITLEEALVNLIKQATLLEYAAPRGGMTAVVDSPDLAQRWPEVFEECEIAGYHSPKSFIVSAPASAHGRAATLLKDRGVSALELPVSYPFHSRWMDEVETPLRAVLSQLSPKAPSIPLISAAKGGPLARWDADHLADAIRSRVDFTRTIGELEAAGDFLYVDLGPSGSMATAVKYSLAADSKSEFLSVMTPYGQDARHLARLIERLERQ